MPKHGVRCALRLPPSLWMGEGAKCHFFFGFKLLWRWLCTIATVQQSGASVALTRCKLAKVLPIEEPQTA